MIRIVPNLLWVNYSHCLLHQALKDIYREFSDKVFFFSPPYRISEEFKALRVRVPLPSVPRGLHRFPLAHSQDSASTNRCCLAKTPPPPTPRPPLPRSSQLGVVCYCLDPIQSNKPCLLASQLAIGRGGGWRRAPGGIKRIGIRGCTTWVSRPAWVWLAHPPVPDPCVLPCVPCRMGPGPGVGGGGRVSVSYVP
jgi:hypothetical protein